MEKNDSQFNMTLLVDGQMYDSNTQWTIHKNNFSAIAFMVAFMLKMWEHVNDESIHNHWPTLKYIIFTSGITESRGRISSTDASWLNTNDSSSEFVFCIIRGLTPLTPYKKRW